MAHFGSVHALRMNDQCPPTSLFSNFWAAVTRSGTAMYVEGKHSINLMTGNDVNIFLVALVFDKDCHSRVHDDEPLRFCFSDHYHPNWHPGTVT
jgi:hypothetical protein